VIAGLFELEQTKAAKAAFVFFQTFIRALPPQTHRVKVPPFEKG
jgi:hypothetical protein